ncbi:MAG: hypothetical protein KIT14_13640 [bacterium]|nr:hypothetical protein [bacterium]
MSEVLVPELETVVADLGRAVIELQKFRVRERDDALALVRATLELGDRARRAHHHRALDPDTAAALLADAQAHLAAIASLLAEVRSSPAYRTAVAAHAHGDHATLVRTLPALFADLAVVDPIPDLHLSVPWIRRARPRPPGELARAAATLARDGVAADADPLAPGMDPDLPAVALDLVPATDEPLVLRLEAAAVPPAVFRLEEAGTHLVHVPYLRVPALAVVPLTLDDEALGEFSVDWERWRAALVEALGAEGVTVVKG